MADTTPLEASMDIALEAIQEIVAFAKLIPDLAPIGDHYVPRGITDRILRLAKVIERIVDQRPISATEQRQLLTEVWIEDPT